jgi:hypothetical protein
VAGKKSQAMQLKKTAGGLSLSPIVRGFGICCQYISLAILVFMKS